MTAAFASAFPVGARLNRLFLLCALTGLAALCLGGGTHSGFAGDALLQFIAIPLALLALYRCFARTEGRLPGFELLLCVLIVLIPVLQSIPVPPWMWAHFPARDILAESLRLAGGGSQWLPLSVTPEKTSLAALSLIPPLALFLGVRQLDAAERRHLVVSLLVIAGISVFLGMAQLATGEQSKLRFFEVTNVTEAVGFFANRNHFSAFLYMSLTLASAFAVDAGLKLLNAGRRNRLDAPQIIALTASATLMFLLGSAQIMARSRAGILLTVLALGGIALLTIIDRRNTARKASLGFIAVAVTAVLLFTAQFGVYRFAERLTAVDLQNDTRLVLSRATIEAARAYFPFGSGIGSFQNVYALVETPGNLVLNGFANHAHNDFAEFWLEAGAAGAVVLTMLLMWFARRAFQVWFRPDRRIQPVDALLARAASIAILLVSLHSFVDYPLHTSALMGLTAICCALVTATYPEQAVFLPTSIESSARGSLVRDAENWPPPGMRRQALLPSAGIMQFGPSPSRAAPNDFEGINWPDGWNKK